MHSYKLFKVVFVWFLKVWEWFLKFETYYTHLGGFKGNLKKKKKKEGFWGGIFDIFVF